MAQKLVDTQEQQLTQELRQTHSLTAQQVMLMRMLEMPLPQFEQAVENEINENPALDGGTELAAEGSESYEQARADDGADDMDGADGGDAPDVADDLDRVLTDMTEDDRLPTSDYASASPRSDEDDDRQQERLWANVDSFYDHLHEQVGEHTLTERQQLIMDYLIGSLDADGLLRKDLTSLSDEIAVHEYIDVSADDIERVLDILQTFDPPGIGAQSLQQCLQIQILRRKATPLTQLMHQVVSNHWDDFVHKRWQRITESMQMGEAAAAEVFREIRRLNPRPGAALGEAVGRSTEEVTPDFIVTIDEMDNISFTINRGRVPQLTISRDFEDMIDAYRQNSRSMTRTDKEALLYAQQKVNHARSYIEAIRKRQNTMQSVMRVILHLQRRYILSGDDSDLRPMILKDVAEKAGVDLSTVSRVCSTKYVQLPWGTIRMKQFFSARYAVGGGEEVSTREIKNALGDVVAHEDKQHPLSDIRIAALLKQQGYPIARRTVAKYREQLGIPIAAMRKG